MKKTIDAKNDIRFIESFKSILQTYQEISAMKMNATRQSVLATRSFFNRLSDVFHEVSVSYTRQVQKVQKQSPRSRKKQSAVVLISENAKLYGNITQKVFESCLSYLKDHQVDIFIIGAQGKLLWNIAHPSTSTAPVFVDLPDDYVTMDTLNALLLKLMDYQNIVVFHGAFESVLFQKPISTTIIESEVFDTKNTSQTNKIQFDFEPNLETIVSFFQTQGVSSFLKQSLHEGHLARLASRIRAMEDGIDNTNKLRTSFVRSYYKAKKQSEAKEQSQRFAGMTLW